MNIFVLDHSPVVSAEMMCDKHVVKMIIESAQMLSTAHRYLDGNPISGVGLTSTGKTRKFTTWQHPSIFMNSALCKAVMVNHPCTKWTMESVHNYKWLYHHGYALCKEYTHRYGKTHKMESLYNEFLITVPFKLLASGKHALTPFAQAMPEKYKNPDAIIAYRNYYLGEKKRFAKWTKRNVPDWYSEGLTAVQNVV